MSSGKETTSQRICPHCHLETNSQRCPQDGFPTVDRKHLSSGEDGLIGKILEKKYLVDSLIGFGGVGSVYKARHLQTEAIVAIKVLLTELSKSLEAIKRFYNEAKLASSLKHPNTVRIFDFGQTEDGQLYMVMELLEGKSLTKVMKTESPLQVRRIINISEQILRSLGEAHEKGLIHRDLKPDNIFILESFGVKDFVKVLDFGFAKSLKDDSEELTKSGILVGTPKYMSPEQAKSLKLDGRSDLYSLGIIMYRMAAGFCPFEGSSAMNILMRHIHEPPKVLEEIALRPLPPAFTNFIARLLSKNPKDRPCSAMEALNILEGIRTSAAGSSGFTEGLLDERSGKNEGMILLHSGQYNRDKLNELVSEAELTDVELKSDPDFTPSTESEFLRDKKTGKKWRTMVLYSSASLGLILLMGVFIGYQKWLFKGEPREIFFFSEIANAMIKNYSSLKKTGEDVDKINNLIKNYQKDVNALKNYQHSHISKFKQNTKKLQNRTIKINSNPAGAVVKRMDTGKVIGLTPISWLFPEDINSIKLQITKKDYKSILLDLSKDKEDFSKPMDIVLTKLKKTVKKTKKIIKKKGWHY